MRDINLYILSCYLGKGTTDEKGYHHLYEHEGLYFRDGLHCIDSMLVYRDVQFNLSITERIWQASCQKKIDDYIDELQKNGLKVELESLKDEKVRRIRIAYL